MMMAVSLFWDGRIFGQFSRTQGLSICQTHICPGKKKSGSRILGILRFKIENALARNVLQNN